MDVTHEQLFVEYAKDLGRAKRAAEAWWQQLMAADATKVGSSKEAAEMVRQRWPLGAASHPYVVAVLRKYWLSCEAINARIDRAPEKSDEQEVSPVVFLCEFLLDPEHVKLAAFIAPLNYWPIGQEPDVSL